MVCDKRFDEAVNQHYNQYVADVWPDEVIMNENAYDDLYNENGDKGAEVLFV
jgi:hypothetical protein